MDWQPIATAPAKVPIEVASFPTAEHIPNITICMNVESMRSAHPEWTHWRPVTAETAQRVQDAANKQ